jgi:cysteinyl-tRNA synthetase
MSLRLFNTLTRRLEDFRPLDPAGKRVGLYVCGPTVYDVPHIGHARSAFIFDVLRRHLASKGYAVTFVRNVTDVDDKIIAKAREELGAGGGGRGAGDLKAKCKDVAERYLKTYHEALERLGIEAPTKEPKATERVVPDMTDFISQLLIQGAAYEAKGDVYFAVRKFAEYGRLSNRALDELQTGSRIEPGEHKQDPLDFALWKAAKPEEPSWPSPWGAGRPGWHIECSVMSTKELGDAFDIHGGGVDLVFPHHENEIAQARALGKPFAKTWLHNGLLTVNGEKMSKSLGNFVTVDQALAGAGDPNVIRMLFLGAHYRSPLDYGPAALQAARGRYDGLLEFLRRAPAGGGGGGAQVDALTAEFAQALDDDLSTPGALAALDKLAAAGRAGAAAAAARRIRELAAVLGLTFPAKTDVPADILRRAKARDEARGRKDFASADRLRREIESLGYTIDDTPKGPVVLPK